MFRTKQDIMARARELFINLTDDAALQQKVAFFGYTTVRLNEGYALLQAVERLQQSHQAAYARQIQMTMGIKQARREAQARYAHHVAEARRAFRNDRDAYSTLGLAGERKRPFNEWVEQATAFYAHLLATPTYMQRMAQFSTEAAALQRGAQLVAAVRTAKAAQDKQISTARALSRQRIETLDALRRWLQTFARHARLALANTPEDLRTLGLAANTPRARQATNAETEPAAEMRDGGESAQWV